MNKKAKSQIIIEIASTPWGRVRGLKSRLEKATTVTLASLPEKFMPLSKRATMTVLLTTDRAVQTLNHDYRGMNKPTNVLSFPAFDPRDLPKQTKGKDELYMGDIAVAYAYTAKEAKAEGKKLIDHTTHLLIHGLLHLFGFDHISDAQARRMEKIEKDIMAALGLPDPYAPLEPK